MIFLKAVSNQILKMLGTKLERKTVEAACLPILAVMCSLQHAVWTTLSTRSESLDSSRKRFAAPTWFVCPVKTYCCFDQTADKIKLSIKMLNETTLGETGAGSLEKYTRVKEMKVNVQSTTCGFRGFQYFVFMYNQPKQGFLYPKLIIPNDRDHKKILLL